METNKREARMGAAVANPGLKDTLIGHVWECPRTGREGSDQGGGELLTRSVQSSVVESSVLHLCRDTLVSVVCQGGNEPSI